MSNAMPNEKQLTEVIEAEYSRLMRPWPERLLSRLMHKTSQTSAQSDIPLMPRFTELKEIEPEEYGELHDIVRGLLVKAKKTNRKREAVFNKVAVRAAKVLGYPVGDVEKFMNQMSTHDWPALAVSEISPKPVLLPEFHSTIQLLVVALGEKSMNHPYLQFNGHTLLGWYGLKAALKPSDNSFIMRQPLLLVPYYESLLYRHPSKIGIEAVEDALYVPREFRRMGMAKELIRFMEFVLKKIDCGNIEIRARNPFLRRYLVEKEGYHPDIEIDSPYRVGKCLWPIPKPRP